MASSTQSILVPRGKESNSDAGSRLTVKFEEVHEISEEFCYIIRYNARRWKYLQI